MPVHNGEAFVREAIASVLSQTYECFELIIINDGSTDDSLKVISSFDDPRIVVISQENRGLAKTLNRGLLEAKGKYIARMDADDICYPRRFETQIKYLRRNPNTKLLGTAVELIDIEGNSVIYDVPYTGSRMLKHYLLRIGNPFKHPTVMFEKAAAEEFGGYNEKIGLYFEDYFLWCQIAKKHKTNIIPEVLLKYRITPGSIMSSIKDDKFSKFMITVVNKGEFSDLDLNLMNQLKKNDRSISVNKEAIYLKRILIAKRNRVNRLASKLSGYIGWTATMKILSFFRGLRACFF